METNKIVEAIGDRLAQKWTKMLGSLTRMKLLEKHLQRQIRE